MDTQKHLSIFLTTAFTQPKETKLKSNTNKNRDYKMEKKDCGEGNIIWRNLWMLKSNSSKLNGRSGLHI